MSGRLIDLQWFAAEDEGRTEEATEHKIRQARERGEVAKSQELIAALGLLFPALTILFLAPYMLRTCVEMIRFFFTRINDLDPVKDSLVAGVFFRYLFRLTWPVAAAAVAAAVFSNMVQVGPLFTVKPLTPKLDRIVPNFGRYFKRTLFSMEGLVNFAKSIVKIGIIGVTAFVLISSKINELSNLQNTDLWTGVTVVADLTIRMLIISALLLLILSIPDMLFQRWQYRQNLKMTRQEVIEERKMYEGDPHVRGRIRQRMRDFMSRNTAAAVAEADVVITNPTHYAVALKYKRNVADWPLVTAKGIDEEALWIRSIAEKNDVMQYEDRFLARTLYAEVDLGKEVPGKYISLIAKVYNTIDYLNEQRRKADGIRA